MRDTAISELSARKYSDALWFDSLRENSSDAVGDKASFLSRFGVPIGLDLGAIYVKRLVRIYA
jgi:hypothetical protein